MQEQTNAAISRVCDYIRQHCQSGASMLLPELSRQAGISPFHLQRTFTKLVGVSPRQYVQACRMQALRMNLRDGSSVTEAIYESGFGSSSRVYERVDTELGMTPSAYRDRGKGLEISFILVGTSLGLMLIAATDRGLCSVQIGDTDEQLIGNLRAEYPEARLQPLSEPYSPLLQCSIRAVQAYLQRQQTTLDLPLDVQATAFQLKVWKYLRAIPGGEVRTYSEVAAAIGQANAVRAVARACASNRLALVIPCHRVIRSDGNLGGYRWGLKRKWQLLQAEQGSAPEA